MSEHPLSTIGELDPETLEKVQQLQSFALDDGELPRKTKLLVAMALDASNGAVNGVRSLAMQAKAEGATKGEIMETLRVVLYIHGASTMYTASAALRDLDL